MASTPQSSAVTSGTAATERRPTVQASQSARASAAVKIATSRMRCQGFARGAASVMTRWVR